ncbi:MAG: sulfatase-like hydrolase/transferase [Planctomycetes bacterium]|nr:sulfatase-like hydrolase/transferase [Planctomycetota bacterium]
MNRKLVLMFGWMTALLGGCSGNDSVGPQGTTLAPLGIPEEGVLGAAKPLDLVVVSIDTLRADRLPFYGAERATGGDPGQKWSLSWVAANSTLFEQVWAPAGMTLPSFGSFWTGLSALEHGALRNFHQVQAPTMVVELEKSGWQAHASVANYSLRPEEGEQPGSGLDPGFKSYQVFRKELEPRGPAELLKMTAADIAASKRSLIWAHYMAPHQPYQPHPNHLGTWSKADGPAGTREILDVIHADPSVADAATLDHLRSLYDEEILTANDYMMEFLSGLEAQYQQAGRGSLLENAVVVVMSDHGEELAFHEGYFMHAKSLYAGVTQVPLMVLGGTWGKGTRIARGISLQEILPMVLHGVQPQATVHFSTWAEGYFAARDERWTLIHNPSGSAQGPKEPPKAVDFVYPSVALFDRLADPLEKNNVASAHPEETRRLLDALHDWYYGLDTESNRNSKPLTPDEIANLEALGYAVGDDGRPIDLNLPWPGSQWSP